MNYVPNASARNMKKKHSAAVGIVCARDYSRQEMCIRDSVCTDRMSHAVWYICVSYGILF